MTPLFRSYCGETLGNIKYTENRHLRRYHYSQSSEYADIGVLRAFKEPKINTDQCLKAECRGEDKNGKIYINRA